MQLQIFILRQQNFKRLYFSKTFSFTYTAFLSGELLIKVTHGVEAIVSHDCGSIEVLIMHRRLDRRASESNSKIFAPRAS